MLLTDRAVAILLHKRKIISVGPRWSVSRLIQSDQFHHQQRHGHEGEEKEKRKKEGKKERRKKGRVRKGAKGNTRRAKERKEE